MKIAVVLFLIIFSATCAANPGPATQFFKDQQATLFDIGMFRSHWAKANRAVADKRWRDPLSDEYRDKLTMLLF